MSPVTCARQPDLRVPIMPNVSVFISGEDKARTMNRAESLPSGSSSREAVLPDGNTHIAIEIDRTQLWSGQPDGRGTLTAVEGPLGSGKTVLGRQLLQTADSVEYLDCRSSADPDLSLIHI